jgi:tetratricopeptide (TPR) repeat protein
MADASRSGTLQRLFAVVERGDILAGLAMLEADPALQEVPVARSYFAYCIAKARGQYREALRLAESALSIEPHNPAHYLNLGRVLLASRHKREAFAAFRQGLSEAAVAQSPGTDDTALRALLAKEMRRMGNRRRVPFPALPREHSLNRVVGKALSRLNLR